MAREDDCFKEELHDDLLFWLTDGDDPEEHVEVLDMFDTIQEER